MCHDRTLTQKFMLPQGYSVESFLLPFLISQLCFHKKQGNCVNKVPGCGMVNPVLFSAKTTFTETETQRKFCKIGAPG
jgi:hypothetical protein